MSKALYRLEVFRNSLEKCAAALEPHGVDLIDVVLNATPEMLESCTNSFIAIVATQIAFVDTLVSVGIQPDFYIGHSLGELGCAYADDTLTAEQTILAAFWRGRAFEESGIDHYAMAAVGESHTCRPMHCLPCCHLIFLKKEFSTSVIKSRLTFHYILKIDDTQEAYMLDEMS